MNKRLKDVSPRRRGGTEGRGLGVGMVARSWDRARKSRTRMWIKRLKDIFTTEAQRTRRNDGD
jgi:hypothetical protein